MRQLSFIIVFILLLSSCTNQSDTITVNIDQGKSVSPITYGWHYEEIGMIGEGGLYAEMVRNRAFEEANMPRGLIVEDGQYNGIPNAGESQRKRVYSIDPLIGWEVIPESGSGIAISRVSDYPLNRSNPHSMKVDPARMAESTNEMVTNTGFFGMSIVSGLEYRLSFYSRSDSRTANFQVFLVSEDGIVISNTFEISNITQKWKKFDVVLNANNTTSKGRLAFKPLNNSPFFLDIVSLFPADTWDNGKSVFRADIMQNLIDYAPEFLRFPGGCLVHGVNVETMYYWKETIGDIAARPGAWGKWQPNYRTDGLGYHEFYELCEYLGADAMYVAPTGLVCTGWVHQDGKSDHYFHPVTNTQDFVQDCLDAIEYAIGSTNTKWGAERAKNGHPEPFPLKYVSVGNEDFGPMYYEKYDVFYKSIKSKYPHLQVIATSIIGNTPDLTNKRKRLSEFIDVSTIEIFDEHYYKDIQWIIDNYYTFDAYDRTGPALMIGEMGINGKHPMDILGEAVFMTMVERNADMNVLCADRPLMRNWTFTKGNGNPLYFHTNNQSWKTMNYYQSKLYRDNKQDIWYPSTFNSIGGDTALSMQTLFTSAGKDSESGDIILKVVNLTDSARNTTLNIGNAKFNGSVQVITLKATRDMRNTDQNSTAVKPDTTNIKIKFPGQYTFEPLSFTVLRIKKE